MLSSSRLVRFPLTHVICFLLQTHVCLQYSIRLITAKKMYDNTLPLWKQVIQKLSLIQIYSILNDIDTILQKNDISSLKEVLKNWNAKAVFKCFNYFSWVWNIICLTNLISILFLVFNDGWSHRLKVPLKNAKSLVLTFSLLAHITPFSSRLKHLHLLPFFFSFYS